MFIFNNLISYCDASRAWCVYIKNSASPQMEAFIVLHLSIIRLYLSNISCKFIFKLLYKSCILRFAITVFQLWSVYIGLFSILHVNTIILIIIVIYLLFNLIKHSSGGGG